MSLPTLEQVDSLFKAMHDTIDSQSLRSYELEYMHTIISTHHMLARSVIGVPFPVVKAFHFKDIEKYSE